MTPQFRLTNLQTGYKGGFAMELAELTIRKHRLNVLTGPNGCGKSTLLNVLAFLQEPEKGVIEFSGKRVRWSRREIASLRERITLLHQSPYLFNGTVAENVGYGLKLRGVRGEELRSKVDSALQLLSLGRFDQRDVRQLSGGECRRVALARALAVDPEVLLLDEPLANLDAHSTAVVERVITALPQFGTTVVMATHVLDLTERFECDVIRLIDGRLDETQKVDVCHPLMMPAF
jgi:tungstate transport system ATP-binding protein